MIAFLLIASNSQADSDKYRSIDFNDGGLSLQIPYEWVYFPPSQIHGDLFNIEVRIKARDEYESFEDELGKIETFHSTLAKTVKENQYYTLLKREPFETKSGTYGLKSIYGYSDAKPSSISYFFQNKTGDFIEIRLRFRRWETNEVWKNIDNIILNGLSLK